MMMLLLQKEQRSFDFSRNEIMDGDICEDESVCHIKERRRVVALEFGGM